MRRFGRILLLTTLLTLVPTAAHAAAPAKKGVPKACLQALDHAEEVTAQTVVVITAVQHFFDTVSEAAGRHAASGTIAAVTAFLNEQTEAMNDLTAVVQTVTIGESVSAYNAAAEKCRSKA